MSILNPTTLAFAERLKSQFNKIPGSRKERLDQLSHVLTEELSSNGIVHINVICTHNSRRSHIGHLMLEIGASYFDLNIHSYSGGTEATQLNPRVITAWKELGIHASANGNKENPRYQLDLYSDGSQSGYYFSKVFDHEVNPSGRFIALMVCDHADANCPFIPGAFNRFSLPFMDPKAYDDSDQEAQAYIDKNYEIGREIFYVLSQVAEAN